MYVCDLKYYENSRAEMLEFLPQGSNKILDVGCGTGAFGKAIKLANANAEVWGTDIHQAAITQATATLDKAIRVNPESNFETLPDGYFDVVFFNDVLEHMIDPYAKLAHIKSKLSPKGCVVASIPNIRFFRVLSDLLFKGDFRYQDDGVMDRTHLRFFTRKSIVRMFEDAGFKIQQIKPLNKTRSLRPFFLYFLSLGLIGKDIFYPQFAVVANKGLDV